MLHPVETCLDVDVPGLTEVFPGDLVEGAHRRSDPGVENEDGRPNLPENAPRERFVRDVAADDVDAEPLSDRAEVLGVACHDGDARFLRDQRFDDAEPEPAATPRDHCFLPFQSFHGDSLLSPSTIERAETMRVDAKKATTDAEAFVCVGDCVREGEAERQDLT